MSESQSPLGRYGPPGVDATTTQVQLLNLPLAVLVASREHYEELMREFRLMALSGSVPDAAAPARLLELLQILGVQYASVSELPAGEIEAAVDRGEATVNLTYEVPPTVGPAAQALDMLMKQADEFCRSEQLLTLARTPLMAEFADWYLRCFIDQIAGRPPEPWTGPLAP